MYLFFFPVLSLFVLLLADQVWVALVRVVSLLVCPSTRACLILAFLARDSPCTNREASFACSLFYFILFPLHFIIIIINSSDKRVILIVWGCGCTM